MTFFTGPRDWAEEHRLEWEYAARYGLADQDDLEEQFFFADRAAEHAPVGAWGPAEASFRPRSASNDSRVDPCAPTTLKDAA